MLNNITTEKVTWGEGHGGPGVGLGTGHMS